MAIFLSIQNQAEQLLERRLERRAEFYRSTYSAKFSDKLMSRTRRRCADDNRVLESNRALLDKVEKITHADGS